MTGNKPYQPIILFLPDEMFYSEFNPDLSTSDVGVWCNRLKRISGIISDQDYLPQKDQGKLPQYIKYAFDNDRTAYNHCFFLDPKTNSYLGLNPNLFGLSIRLNPEYGRGIESKLKELHREQSGAVIVAPLSIEGMVKDWVQDYVRDWAQNYGPACAYNAKSPWTI
jgi:hypothetical protein